MSQDGRHTRSADGKRTRVNHRLAPDGPAPPQPFFTTHAQRLALARERYFEQGIRPSGLVSESVIQSWARCVQAHRDPSEGVDFEPVTESRVRSALTKSRLLLAHAAADLRQLEHTLAGTACTVILTDPQGVVVHAARPNEDTTSVLMPLAGRVGVNLSEDCIGTNAPGVTARTGQPSLVLGAEHYFGMVQVMHCAAAPIRDIEGRVAGVLDVSSESRPFGFDAASVVGLCATAIENRLLRAQSTEHVVVHLQTAPGFLDTPLEGLVGVDRDGRIAWANPVAARLLGVHAFGARQDAATVIGLELGALAALTRRPAGAHRLPSGLAVWMQSRMQAPDGAGEVVSLEGPARAGGMQEAPPRPHLPDRPATVAIPAPALPEAPTPSTAAPGPAPGDAATLRIANRQLVLQTLQECEGNVSRAARRLGVSRGLIYRHLKTG
jgi:transcriptional regulator of acetoin/glycerol metabolism